MVIHLTLFLLNIEINPILTACILRCGEAVDWQQM